MAYLELVDVLIYKEEEDTEVTLSFSLSYGSGRLDNKTSVNFCICMYYTLSFYR